MDNLTVAMVAAGVAGALGAWAVVRGALGVRDEVEQQSPTSGGARALLAVPGAFILRRREKDRELARKLAEYEGYIAQAGGKFLEGATAAEIFAARYVFPTLAIVTFVVLGAVLHLSSGLVFILSLFFGGLLFCWPESGLKAMAAERTAKFVRELPLSLDVMRLVTQSGGDLQNAIHSVIQVSQPGPVREELSRCLGEVAIGTSLATALNHVAERINTPQANAVFSTLAQSLEMGTSVSENVGSAAALIRHQARIAAQAKAQKAVVAMSFPLLLLILPGVFIVLFAPLIIEFMNR